jgi:hypothetical protein
MAARLCATVVLTVALLVTGVAHAGDFCFNSTSPPNPAPPTNPDIVVVAQKLRLPRPGKCGFTIPIP